LARTTEDEIIRGIYVPRNDSEKLTISNAFDRYRKDVSPTKQASTREREKSRIKQLKSSLGNYSLASLNSETIAQYKERLRDKRIADGKSNNTVRLELALLSHLYTPAISERGLGIVVNPLHKRSQAKPRQRPR
jgi:hypothetical protein